MGMHQQEQIIHLGVSETQDQQQDQWTANDKVHEIENNPLLEEYIRSL